MQHRSSLSAPFSMEGSPIPVHFGAHLRLLRDRHALSQAEIVHHLDTWQQAAYSKVESGTRAPLFEQLEHIYRALIDAGVLPTVQDRDHFYFLARDLLESRQRRHTRQSDEAWNALYTRLAAIDGLPMIRGTASTSFQLLTQRKRAEQGPRREIGHLLGREKWLASVLSLILRPSPMKVLVFQGPPGCGKTSELHRLTHHFAHSVSRYAVVLSEPSPIQLERLEPTDVLERLLSDMQEVVGSAYPTMPTGSLQARINYVLGSLAKTDRSVVIGLDNAEHIFDVQGKLETTWQRFLIQFAQADHNATLIIASQEWPAGMFLAESQLMTTVDVPPLSRREGAQLLQALGLRSVSEELLAEAVERTGGMPVCLEWVVRLVREPFLRDEWSEFEERDDSTVLARLLDDPALFGGAVAQRVHPLLNRVLKRLSSGAAMTLQDLAIAPVPLGAPALRILYQTPKVLRELREASLLVSYPQRVQLLPMVAAQVQQSLSNDQARAAEGRLIQALLHWLTAGHTLDNREMGSIIAAIAEIYLRHHRLLDAAQFIIRYGGLSFRLGHARRLAQFALKSIEEVRHDQENPPDLQQSCGMQLLYYYLAPHFGERIDGRRKEAEYRHIHSAALAATLHLQPAILVFIMHNLMLQMMNEHRFEEAQNLLNATSTFLASFTEDVDLQASLLEKRAWLFGRWCEYQHEQRNRTVEQEMREQAIGLYQQCSTLLAEAPAPSALLQYFFSKRRAKVLHFLGYHLSRRGRNEEALQALLESLHLQKQGYSDLDSLPPLYGDIAQTLLVLGQFEEAKSFDEQAYTEAEQLARAGYTFSQEELHIHRANRGNLYLHLGKVDEAEVLLAKALPHIHLRRSMYKTMAMRAHDEIQQWRKHQGGFPLHYQLDWRYVERYRALASYDTYWWWGAAGPFTQEEQQEWDQQYTSPLGEKKKAQLGQIIRHSRNREIEAALAEYREPHFCYPALDIEQVHAHLEGFQKLDREIESDDRLHPLVQRWYREGIEEEITVLRLIEAAYDGDSELVRDLNRQLIPEPTKEEMAYALSRLRRLIIQARLQAEKLSKADNQGVLELGEAADQMATLLSGLGLQMDWSTSYEEELELLAEPPLSPVTATASALIPHQAAVRFVEAILEQAGFTGWRVIPDPLSRDPHLEQALRHVYLPTRAIPVEQLKDYVRHELLDGHVARCVAGEQSLIGLLGIHLQNSLEMEEGLATYKEIQNAALHGRAHDETGIWFGTIAVGLAFGVVTPPQTFSKLFSFFEALIYLYRLVKRPDQSVQLAYEKAQAIALGRCIRTFRGVPDLTVPGVCYTKDVLYQRGLHKIMKVLESVPTVVDRLAVGVVALEHLPDLEKLGITAAPQSFKTVMQDGNIDAYILSFVHADGE
ncbi:MAG TPA: tyrosine/phenylalanine carboxypeptidase domain-containing protein [Ktedonosporobacter sp.]|nr:tyrosine/phenylalanine carboxypeptidase domain-containing protein [Ktedonosporobacter sp.]